MMQKQAIERAQIAYGTAVKELADMEAANDFPSIERHWGNFLIQVGRVYGRLEQGAKSSARSYAWWSKKAHERRTDPLLCYVWHARNVDEHTLEPAAELNPGSVKSVEPTEGELADLQHQLKKEGRPVAVLGLLEVVYAHATLLDVIDRGKLYRVPRSHLGAPLEVVSPAIVGQLALAYLAIMMTEARELTE